MSLTILDYDTAVARINAATSPRAQNIAKLRRYVDGTQYDGRCPWFASDGPPLWERAPCIVDPVVQNAIAQKVDLVCGEGRFPNITSASAYDDLEADTGDTETSDDNEGDPAEEDTETSSAKVTEETAKAVDKCLASLEKMADFRTVSRESLTEGLGTSSIAIIFGTRNGRVFAETIPAEWCTPDIAVDRVTCKKLDIMYGYVDIVTEGDHLKAVPKMFRRVVDDSRDVTYIPVIIREGMNAINMLQHPELWIEDPEQLINHALGFCPVHWYPVLRGCKVAGRIDGHAIHENSLDEIDGYNFSLSQRHRAALYSGDPQWTEIGVEEGYNPSRKGRAAKVLQKSSPQGGIPGPGNEAHKGGYVDMGVNSKAPKRTKGPGEVWQYAGDKTEVEVKLHTLPGDALEALDNNAKDLERKLEKAFGIVSLDPDHIPKGNVLAASAMKTLKSYMHASCDKLRADFGERLLLPSYGMLLRIAVQKGIKVPGIKEATELLDRMGANWSWICPPFELSWGDYDQPDPADQLALVQLAIQANDAGFTTKKVVITMLRGVLGLGQNIDAYLEELDKEQKDKAQNEIANTEQTATADHQRALELEAQKAKSKGPPK